VYLPIVTQFYLHNLKDAKYDYWLLLVPKSNSLLPKKVTHQYLSDCVCLHVGCAFALDIIVSLVCLLIILFLIVIE